MLANITQPPTLAALSNDTALVLNTTMLTTYDNWETTWLTLWYFFRETKQESYYGYVNSRFHFTRYILSHLLKLFSLRKTYSNYELLNAHLSN